jgi:hypothetical protein
VFSLRYGLNSFILFRRASAQRDKKTEIRTGMGKTGNTEKTIKEREGYLIEGQNNKGTARSMSARLL